MRNFPTQVGPGGEPVSDQSSFTSSNANDVIQEHQFAITSSGQTLIPLVNPADNTQVAEAIARYAAVGTFYVDSGTAGMYVLSTLGAFKAPSTYLDGQLIRWVAANTNVGSSVINANSVGSIPLTSEGGAALTGGEVSTTNQNTARYNLASNRFELLSSLAGVALLASANTFTQPQTFASAILKTGIANASWAAQTDDYALGADVSILRVTLTGSQTLTGIVAASGGRDLTIQVVGGTGSLTLAQNSGSSSAGNKFLLPGGQTLVVPLYGAVRFIYDAANSFWRVAGEALGNATDNILHVRDEKTSGTTGGPSIAGVNTRVLDTIKTNTISGASVLSNQITLAAGTYEIEASAPAREGNTHKVYLYNITDASDTLIGTSEFADNTGQGCNRSFVNGRFTIASTKVFELRHYITAALASVGLGDATSTGQVEVYAEVIIRKVS